MDDHLGEQFGDYHLTQILGKGNFGDVYFGEHIKNKKQAAIKVLHARLTSKEDLKDYINELRSLFRLEHPNIVRLRDFGIERDFPYLVMDYIPNGRLRQPKGTRLPLSTVVSYVKQIADALQFAHDQGIIHRDVKPDNILLGSNSQVWLSDFGIAAVAHSTNSYNNQGNAGTIAYMAPEQLQGKPGKASDQYALGIMTYEWICGIRPFNGTSTEIHNQHLYTSPPLMREYIPTLSALVEEVVLKTLAKDPKQRFTNLRAFANALEQAFNASLIPEPEPPVAQELIKPMPDQQPAAPIGIITLPVLVQQPAMPVVVIPPPIAPGNDIVVQNMSSPPVTTFPKQQKGKNRRRWLLIIVPIALIALLVPGVIFAINNGLANPIGAVTGAVAITPAHQTVSDSFVVTAVTGTPDPTAHQIQARILSYTPPSQSASANGTGSIGGANATGTLVFSNIGNGVQISGGTLTSADGVQVSFGSFFLPFGSSSVQGTAVNQGTRGNIPALNINGSCCGDSSVRVRNPGAFSGGRDPVPNPVITQNDINAASNNLVSTLKPSTQAVLQQQLKSGEKVVSGSLKCTSNVTADHRVGDQAKSVTLTGTVTCTEEAYDEKAALDIVTNALKEEAAKNPAAGYALAGNVVTTVTSATVVDTKHTVSLVIAAQGEWVYQFTVAILTGIKNKIAKESESAAQADLLKTPGVLSATIGLSSGTMMPDTANITINVVNILGVSVSPTTTPITTPTGSPAITPTTGLGGGPPATFTPGGS